MIFVYMYVCDRYLMKLPTPVIPTEHYHHFLHCGKVVGGCVCMCVWSYILNPSLTFSYPDEV